MTTYGTPEYWALIELCRQHLREPYETTFDGDTAILVFVPPLTAEEQAILTRLERLARATISMSPADWQLVEDRLPSLRANRTRTDAQWTALTAAQRDTALIAWCRDLTDVLRAMLRD